MDLVGKDMDILTNDTLVKFYDFIHAPGYLHRICTGSKCNLQQVSAVCETRQVDFLRIKASRIHKLDGRQCLPVSIEQEQFHAALFIHLEVNGCFTSGGIGKDLNIVDTKAFFGLFGGNRKRLQKSIAENITAIAGRSLHGCYHRQLANIPFNNILVVFKAAPGTVNNLRGNSLAVHVAM